MLLSVYFFANSDQVGNVIGKSAKEREGIMAKEYGNIAQEVVRLIGGESNVSHLEHCSTRLRFSVNDPDKVNREALKKTSGVMGVVGSGNQCQVVIGNDVIEVYDEILKLGSFNNGGGADSAASGGKRDIGGMVLDFMVGVFQPLVPAIAGAGILKALLSLLTLAGVMSTDSSWYTILYNGADAALYFLPVMVGCTMATKLNMNRIVAIAVTGVLILPNITAALADGIFLAGFQLQNVALLYYVEKFFTKISPKPIRVFFVPMMCFIIVVPISLLVLAPLGYNVGQLLTAAILFVYDKLGWIAVALLAAILPFMISMGMHKALVPYAVTSITEMGEELLYMPASLAHNISEGGACFAVALKTKDEELRSAAISAGISAIFGITEPALYGVTLQHKKALYGVIGGSFIGGLVIGLTGVKAFVAMGPGLAGMAMFVDPANNMNIVWAFLGFGVSVAASFILTLFLFKDEAEEIPVSEAPKKLTADGKIASPINGTLIPLSEVPDDVFAQGVLGEGMAIVPSDGEVYAPADATIASVFDTKHAISMVCDNGAEILIHVGLDTVKLNGQFYTPHVKDGDKVKAGQIILSFDKKAVEKAGYKTITPVIVTNSNELSLELAMRGSVEVGSAIMNAEKA